MRNLLLVVSLLSLGACAMNKTKIMDVASVSMTHNNVPAGTKLEEKGPVTGEFCANSFGDKGNVGLMDEAVKKAQSTSNVDFILNASFWQSGSCISVEGTGAKMMEVATNTATPAKASKKK
ncbi:MAG: hypothetical protein ACOYL6_12755 [Bacteriovoracaceae bacterium]